MRRDIGGRAKLDQGNTDGPRVYDVVLDRLLPFVRRAQWETIFAQGSISPLTSRSSVGGRTHGQGRAGGRTTHEGIQYDHLVT